MEEKVFQNQLSRPNEPELQSALGHVYPYYQQLITLAGSFSREWLPSKTSGWMLKVYDQKKALFYLIPLRNAFKISLTIRENEKDTFLKDDELKLIHPVITAAKKYVEGFALQFLVANENDCQTVALLIKKLIGFRS